MSLRDLARRARALGRPKAVGPGAVPTRLRPVLTSDEKRRRIVELVDIARRRVAGELPTPARPLLTLAQAEESRRRFARVLELAEIASQRCRAGEHAGSDAQ